ncbi:MAG: hypothetical protein FWF98_02375 [Dehalococcoidia bacterium]|nr:hypothetical protein [Dehalococcoidia bacterium]
MAESEITIKSTKAEIMEALRSAQKRAEVAERGSLNPEKEEWGKIEAKAIEGTKAAVEQNIFSKELNAKFSDLQVAIAAEENRLSELYDVGTELQKLALAIEAGKEKIAKLELEKAEKENAIAKSIETLNAEYDAHVKKLKVDRERENEEFQYNLARAREKEENVWADKCAVREAELLKHEAQAKELLSDAEAKAEYMNSLEEKVKNIPNLLQAEKDSAIQSTTEALQREFEYKSALTGKDSQNSISRLEDKISFLAKELDSSNKLVETLQAKLDKAYVEIRELATKTVESASGVRIIGSGSENKNA